MAGRATVRRINDDREKEVLAAESRICQQIDNLQRISQQQRKDQIGDEWFRTIRDAYNLFPRDTETPIFRPTMRIPEAQILGFMEAIDLTDIDPRIFLCKTFQNYEQDENAEACLQAQWRDSQVNLNVLYALMWSWFCGCGFIQVGYDEQMRHGRGDTTCYWRDPQTVFPDPYAIDDKKWQYVILEDFMWLDTIKQYWPIPAERVVLNRTPEPLPLTSMGRNSAFGLEVPTGPMQGMIPGLPVSSTPGDARVRVRTLFLRDNSRVRVDQGPKAERSRMQLSGMAKQTYRMRYPRGRMIVEANGVILFDGENPYWHGEFPIVRFLGMPALHGFWAPPPFRYTKALQDMAERFTTQDFENMVRLLNGVWFIDESTGIDTERFGGVPGETQMIAQGSPVPSLVQPKGSGEGIQAAELLLTKQRLLQGFGDPRMGLSPAGNVSNDLFTGSLMQGQTLTRGRARLMYEPIRRLAYLMFTTMAQFTKDERLYADPRADGFGTIRWTPVLPTQVLQYEAHVDPASLQPFSGVMIRQLALALKNMGALDTEGLLEAVRYPNRKKILDRLNKEAQMQMQMAAQMQELKNQKKPKT
jgi:hypothetical protein